MQPIPGQQPVQPPVNIGQTASPLIPSPVTPPPIPPSNQVQAQHQNRTLSSTAKEKVAEFAKAALIKTVDYGAITPLRLGISVTGSLLTAATLPVFFPVAVLTEFVAIVKSDQHLQPYIEEQAALREMSVEDYKTLYKDHLEGMAYEYIMNTTVQGLTTFCPNMWLYLISLKLGELSDHINPKE